MALSFACSGTRRFFRKRSLNSLKNSGFHRHIFHVCIIPLRLHPDLRGFLYLCMIFDYYETSGGMGKAERCTADVAAL